MKKTKAKGTLKAKLKLIRLIIYLFFFLFLVALFMGISSNPKKNRAEADEELDNISTNIPSIFSLESEDYKKSSSDDAETTGITETNEIIANPLFAGVEEAIPKAFLDNRSYDGDSSKEQDMTYSNQNNARLQQLLDAMNGARRNNKASSLNDAHLEKGRTSGLFVGAQGIEGGGTQSSVAKDFVQNMTGQLKNVFNTSGGQDGEQNGYQQQNAQNSKRDFLDAQRSTQKSFQLNDVGYQELDPVVIAGSIIPLVMITEINSDLPGMISARVTQNIYDTFYGTELLIPKGSIVIGNYDSSISWGQSRVLVVWDRLTRPDGYSIALEGMQGASSQGSAGVQGQVKTYLGASLGASLLTSVFNVGIDYTVYKANSVDNTGLLEEGIRSTEAGVSNTLGNVSDRFLNRQPTIKIRQGTLTTIFVHKDIKIPVYQKEQ